MMTEVRLVPTVVVRDAKDIERGLKVLQKAEANCLISKFRKGQGNDGTRSRSGNGRSLIALY